MRCYWGSTIRSGIAIVIVTGLYLSVGQIPWRKTSWSNGHEWSSIVPDTIMPFNVTLDLLAGTLPPIQKYLTVGLSSVKRKKENYLMDTLNSIFSHSSKEELSEMVVVVLLADFDLAWVKETRQKITSAFHVHLNQGELLVIHASQDLYPPLTGLKRNFNDAPDRVTFRSKQNVDYSFLVHFSANLSQYFIMVEDDVLCAQGFLSAIRKHVLKMGSTRWTTLEFSKLGYIGKLYHSEDLPLLARFLLLFYQEMPCDFLLSHFRTLLMQDKVIRMRPSLFQHMGKFSSFLGTYNGLKDDEFVEEPADNPPAEVLTNIEPYKDKSPVNAYNQGSDFFWGLSPKQGDYFMVMFNQPVLLSRISIETGSENKYILLNAVVEVGRVIEKSHTPSSCSDLHSLGLLNAGQFEMRNIYETVKSTVACLNIRVTQKQNDWVRIQNIRVWERS
ncbi:LOW QUALITY PROTEIN: alpha-1,3-mannosyl-glycoprotein 4-beta-N-acetylglucosaminyltransferase C-like [Sardina pilchardus]|uniref:LOW QUALITY PROTEIN: alpha-1,3-mannosyl-glycoprotein 4-beta-N-acetylglucosaminyltransferase C-like n=1 Tax=Sardina pilchardus TaxID=27697 RepID=UPI002E15707B